MNVSSKNPSEYDLPPRLAQPALSGVLESNGLFFAKDSE